METNKKTTLPAVNVRTTLVEVESDGKDFTIRCLRDTNNEPTAMQANKTGGQEVPQVGTGPGLRGYDL